MNERDETGVRGAPDRRPVLLYDGSCAICSSLAARLGRAAGERLELRSFRTPGALDGLGGLRPEDCEMEVKLVGPDGRIRGGAEAILRALALGRRWMLPVASLARLPVVRGVVSRSYAWVAGNRFRLSRRTHAHRPELRSRPSPPQR